MTSSVEERRRWKARRIECCLASSREKTVICFGSPISPERSRRTSTFPSEPVPPVTTTRLSASIVSPNLVPNLVIGSCVRRHPFDHLRPRSRNESSGLSKSLAVKTAIANESFVWLDLDVHCKGLFQQQEQVKLINWLSRDVPDAA